MEHDKIPSNPAILFVKALYKALKLSSVVEAETTLNLYEPAKKPVKASSTLYRPPKPSFKRALNELQSHPPSPQTPSLRFRV